MKHPGYIILFLLTVFLIGCTTEECIQNKTALPYAGFYESGGNDQSVSIDSLQIYGYHSPGDSILFDGKSRINKIYLPFKTEHDTTTYIFRYLHKELAAQGITDTVSFIYDRDPRFVSLACGVSYVYKIKKIYSSGVLIDSVVCPRNEIDNMDTENLKIYFRTK